VNRAILGRPVAADARVYPDPDGMTGRSYLVGEGWQVVARFGDPDGLAVAWRAVGMSSQAPASTARSVRCEREAGAGELPALLRLRERVVEQLPPEVRQALAAQQ
jgi:hypothetical protein